MQSHSDRTHDYEEAVKAFERRMMQNALSHTVGRGIDLSHVRRLQLAGLLRDATAEPIPTSIVEIISDHNHPDRRNVADGPLVFFSQHGTVSVIEPETLLLNDDLKVRSAGLEYVVTDALSKERWLTRHSEELIEKHSRAILSNKESEWRRAVILVVPAIRRDLLRHLAALRQCITARYHPGVIEHLNALLRPNVHMLVHLRPPIWKPTEQQSEIEHVIAGAAVKETITDALDTYIAQCGYLPLSRKLSARRVLDEWQRKHPGMAVKKEEIASWAARSGTPSAQYHALILALDLPNALHDTSEGTWADITALLGSTVPDEEGGTLPPQWQLYCCLASHFVQRIEAVHPGQDGEQVACYAWWLADRMVKILGPTDQRAQNALKGTVYPELAFSSFQWKTSRSPVVPSPIRYGTLYVASIWAMSLLSQMSERPELLASKNVPDKLREGFGALLRAYLVGSPLANRNAHEKATFAFEENDSIYQLCALFVSEEDHRALAALAEVRASWQDQDVFEASLHSLAELPEGMQHLVCLFLRDSIFTTHAYDELVARWLTNTDEFIGVLQKLPGHSREAVFEMLMELHLRQTGEWAVRLPHVLVFAAEQSDDEDFAEEVLGYTLWMSLTSGIGSSVDRIAASKWRGKLLPLLRSWRSSLAEVANFCEPWVRSRVRGMSASISRIAGPDLNKLTAPLMLGEDEES